MSFAVSCVSKQKRPQCDFDKNIQKSNVGLANVLNIGNTTSNAILKGNGIVLSDGDTFSAEKNMNISSGTGPTDNILFDSTNDIIVNYGSTGDVRFRSGATTVIQIGPSASPNLTINNGDVNVNNGDVNVSTGDLSVNGTSTLSGDVILDNNNDLEFNGALSSLRYISSLSVTQTVSLSTGVTANSTTGRITLFSTLIGGQTANFTLTNSTIATDSIILLSVLGTSSNTNIATSVSFDNVALGSLNISVTNNDILNATNQAPVVHFIIVNPV